jgi:protein-disulfide isomerase
MSRLVIAAVLIVGAVVVAMILRRRRPEPPTQPKWAVPTQLDRGDFDRPDVPWLVVVFSSATCASCEAAWDKVAMMASDDVAVQDVPWQGRQGLHKRYGVEAAPTIVVADGEGVVQASFVGNPPAGDLWGAVAAARGTSERRPG